jgi:tetratricopeptide (TPR) repeat protein
MQQYDEALKYYSQALEWLENQKTRDPAMKARCLVGLGNVYWGRGELDEALDYAEQALAIREREVKPRNDFDIAACLGNMGNILHDQGDTQRALSCAKKAVEILHRSGKDDLRFSAALNNLGAMYQSTGDYVKAREYFERALESLPSDKHPHRQSTINNIARLNAIEKAQN